MVLVSKCGRGKPQKNQRMRMRMAARPRKDDVVRSDQTGGAIRVAMMISGSASRFRISPHKPTGLVDQLSNAQ